MTPGFTLDLRADAGVLDLDRTGSGRVVARDGGYFVRLDEPDGDFVFRSSPVLGATSVCTDGPLHWVTSSTGYLWCERDGAWSSRFLSELAGVADVQVIADRGRTWLVLGGRLREVTERGLEDGAPIVAGRLVRVNERLYVVGERSIASFEEGTLREAISEHGLVPPATCFRALGPAAGGGLHVVDDAGALYRFGDSALTPVRRGHISISDPVVYAEVSPDGKVASWRTSHERDGRVALVIDNRYGRETHRWKIAPPIVAVIDGRTPRLFGDFTTVPRPALRRLTAEGALLDSGLVTPLPGLEGDQAEWAKTMTVGAETWTVDDRALLIDAPKALQTRYAFAAPLLGLARDPFGQPVLLDRWGTQHVFDGARFDASACAGDGDVIDARIAGGKTVRLLRARGVDDVPLHHVEPPVDGALLEGDGGALQRHLDKGVAELALVRVPAPAEKAHAALGGWTRVGRSAAGVALAELLAGTEDAPGPAANADIAAAVTRELPASAAFYVLEDVAFAAVLETPTWIVCPHAERGRVLESLRKE